MCEGKRVWGEGDQKAATRFLVQFYEQAVRACDEEAVVMADQGHTQCKCALSTALKCTSNSQHSVHIKSLRHESVLSTSTVCGPGGPGPGGHDIARAATSANPESMGAMVGSITYCWVLRAVNILLVTDRLRVLTVYMLW